MQIIDIIECKAKNDVLVWKSPVKDFNAQTQLIVHASQQAVFFRDGQDLDSFGSGRHTLVTENIPLLNKALHIGTDQETPFSAEVYFVNCVEAVNKDWGISNDDLSFMEKNPVLESPCKLQIGASGSINFTVENARTLLLKIVGQLDKDNGHDAELKTDEFYDIYLKPQTRRILSTELALIFSDPGYSILELDGHRKELGEMLFERLSDKYKEYGLLLKDLQIERFVFPESDLTYRRLREIPEKMIQRKITQLQNLIDLDLATNQQKIDWLKIENEIKELKGKRISEQQRLVLIALKEFAANPGTGTDMRNMITGALAGIGFGGGIARAMDTLTVNTVGDVGLGQQVNWESDPVSQQVNTQAPSAMKTDGLELYEMKDESTLERNGNANMSVIQMQGNNITAVKDSGLEYVCYNCNTSIMPGDVFCDQCGTQVACKNCGAVFHRAGKICPQCGKKREQ